MDAYRIAFLVITIGNIVKRDLADLTHNEPQIDEDLWGDHHARAPLKRWQKIIGVAVLMIVVATFIADAVWR